MNARLYVSKTGGNEMGGGFHGSSINHGLESQAAWVPTWAPLHTSWRNLGKPYPTLGLSFTFYKLGIVVPTANELIYVKHSDQCLPPKKQLDKQQPRVVVIVSIKWLENGRNLHQSGNSRQCRTALALMHAEGLVAQAPEGSSGGVNPSLDFHICKTGGSNSTSFLHCLRFKWDTACTTSQAAPE